MVLLCMMPYFLQQETVVVPDRKLMLEAERQMASTQTGPYLDFFLALAICNTVLVSSATAQRQRVRANAGLAGAERVGDMLKNSPHVKTITIIGHHVNLAHRVPHCPEIFYHCPCMTNSSSARASQPGGMFYNYCIVILQASTYLAQAIIFFIRRPPSPPHMHL